MDTLSAKVTSVPTGFSQLYNAKLGATELEAFKEHVRRHESAAKMLSAKLFREADTDRNGTISFDEYFTHRVRTSQGGGFKRDELKREFDAIDTDKSGALDWNEVICFQLCNLKVRGEIAQMHGCLDEERALALEVVLRRFFRDLLIPEKMQALLEIDSKIAAQ